MQSCSQKERGNISGKSLKLGISSAKDLTIMLTEGCDSPYHRLD